MASQTELESMIIRLIGDGSSYQKMTLDAAKQSQVAADKVQVASKQIENIANQTKSFASAAVGALTSLGLAASLKGAFDAYENVERTQIRMKNAIIATGQAVEPTLAQYKKLSDEIMASTTTSKGEVNALIEKAQGMGFYGAQLERAVKNSLAFAAATNQSAESGFHMAKAMETGNQHMLQHALGFGRMNVSATQLNALIQGKLAAGYRDLAEYNNTATGRLEKLGRTLKGLTVEFGGLVAAGLQPVIDKVERLVAWFGKLDPQVKQIAKVVTLVALAFVSFGPIMSFLAPIFGAITGSFTILGSIIAFIAPLVGGFWPALLLVGAAMAVVGTIIGGFIVKMGGLGNAWAAVKMAGGVAWDWIKAKAMQFWNWLYPVVQAAMSFLKSVWEVVSDAAVAAWDFIETTIITAWNNAIKFLEEHGINFDDFRDKVQMAFIFAEFVVRNFSQVWAWVWAGAKLQFIVLADILVTFFTVTLPLALDWLSTNWREVFQLMWTVVKNVLANDVTAFTNFFNWIVENAPTAFSVFKRIMDNVGRNWITLVFDMVKLLKSIPDLVKGNVNIAQLQLFNFDDLADGINNQFSKLDLTKGIKALDEGFIRQAKALNIPERVIGPLERQLREEYERLGANVAGSFADFYSKKLAEFAANSKEVDMNKKAGSILGSGFNAGVKSKVEELKGILWGSAEAMVSWDKYRENLKKINATGVTGPGGNPAAPGAPAPVPAPQPVPPPNPITVNNDNRRDRLLKAIQDAIIGLAGKQGIVVVPANLG